MLEVDVDACDCMEAGFPAPVVCSCNFAQDLIFEQLEGDVHFIPLCEPQFAGVGVDGSYEVAVQEFH